MWYSDKFVQYSPKESGFSSLRIIHKEKLLQLYDIKQMTRKKKVYFMVFLQ